MTKDELVAKVKDTVSLWRAGKQEEAYAAYKTLFSDAGFAKNRPEDQRQALKLMVHARGVPHKPTPAMLAAHKAAVAPLTALVAAHGDPADYEMLGMCHITGGDTAKASELFRAGLKLERERSPQSDLCGALMRRISEI